MKGAAALIATAFVASTTVDAAPSTPAIPAAIAAAYEKNHDGVKEYTLFKVVDGHNDYSKQFPAGTSVGAMYDGCLAFCKQHQCHTFDLVFNKYMCYLDTTTADIIPEHVDNNAVYVTTSSVAASPNPAGPEICYGFGYKWATGETFTADNQVSQPATIASLTTQCGSGDAVCKKWATCDQKCGALALPPNSYMDGDKATPGVAFAPSKASAAAKALAACQKLLDNQGIDDECKVVESYCMQ